MRLGGGDAAGGRDLAGDAPDSPLTDLDRGTDWEHPDRTVTAK